MIKVDLITGFLGAGKTTFLLKYARYLMNKGLKIGILEYDYGSINVDMVLLGELRGPKCELEMVAAGCDRDCLERRFKTKLIAMSGYDRVIVEPSGVFDMDMFYDALREEPLENWYEIGSVIAIADATMDVGMSAVDEFVMASQVCSAGMIVLSKVQLVSDIQSVKTYIVDAQKNIGCNKLATKFIDKCWDELTDNDFDYIANPGYSISDYAKKYADEDLGYSSVSFLETPGTLSKLKEKITILLKDASYGNVIRVKGFINENGVNYRINASKGNEYVVEASSGPNVITVIGSELNEESIINLLNE